MKVKLLISLVVMVLLLSATIIKAQDTLVGYSGKYVIDTRLNELTGTVKNSHSGDPIQGAALMLEGPVRQYQAISQSDGSFSFGLVAPGNYNLIASMGGYVNFGQYIDITGEQGQLLEVNMIPLDNSSLVINADLTAYADNIVEGPSNVYKLIGNIHINDLLHFEGELTIDMRWHLLWKEVYGSGRIFMPDVAGKTKEISTGSTPFKFYAQGEALYASGYGSFFVLPTKIGGFSVKLAAIELSKTTQSARLRTIPDLPYPVSVVFEHYMGLNLPLPGLLDIIKANIVYSKEGEAIEVMIKNLQANLGAVSITDLSLYYSTDGVFGGELALKLPGRPKKKKKGESNEIDTLKVKVHNEIGELMGEVTFDEFVDKMSKSPMKEMEIEMKIEFVSGALNNLSVKLSGVQIPLFSTGLFITGIHGGVYDLADEKWYLEASVDIETGLQKIPGTNISPLKLSEFGVMIQPLDVFRGGGTFQIFNMDVGGGFLEFNRPLSSVSLEGYYLAYGGILKGQIFAGVDKKGFMGSGIMTVKTPSIPCSWRNPWLCGVAWAGNRHIGTARIDINNGDMRSLVYVKAGRLGTLSLAQRMQFGKTSAPWFHYYLGRNYNSMKKIWKGTKDGMQEYIFQVPENTSSLMVSANDTINLKMFDFTLMGPTGVLYEGSYLEEKTNGTFSYECFHETNTCVMIVDKPMSGNWTFLTEYEGEISLYTLGLDQVPSAMVNHPNEQKSKSNEISLVINDYADTLSVEVYYNTHNREFNGTLINRFSVINNANLNFTWNNEDVPNGEYYIYTRIDDGKNAPVLQYSQGSILVENDPYIDTPQNVTVVPEGDKIMVSWDDPLSENTVATVVYYKDQSTSRITQVPVLDDPFVYLADLARGRGYHIWCEFVNDAGTYGRPSNMVEFIFTSDKSNNPPFFTLDRKIPWVFVEGEPNTYTINAYDADGDLLVFSIPNDTLGISISGDQLSWKPSAEQTGAYWLPVAVSDGLATDTTFVQVVVYTPEQVRTKLEFNSFLLFEQDNTFLKLRNFYAEEPTQIVSIINLRTNVSTEVECRRVDEFNYMGQFYLSFAKRTDVEVANGDTIVAVYSYDGNTYKAMAIYDSIPQKRDVIAPGVISDLQAERLSGNRVRLSWTATGNDGDMGTAYRYDIRYSHKLIDEELIYFSASLIPQSPYPSQAGEQDYLIVNLMNLGEAVDHEMIYFSIKAEDEAHNRGKLSNSPGVEAIPEPFNVVVEVNEKYQLDLAWEGPDAGLSNSKFLYYSIYRKVNHGSFERIKEKHYEKYFSENLRVFADGAYQYGIRMVFEDSEGERITSATLQLNRFVNVNILCELAGMPDFQNIEFAMTGLDDVYSQQFERSTGPTGLLMLHNVFKGSYLVEITMDGFMPVTETITVSDHQRTFSFTLFCEPVIPENLRVQDASVISASFLWETGSMETQWDIIYGPRGFDPATGGILFGSVLEKPFHLSGLMPGSPFDVYVRSVCGPYHSNWSVAVPFNTEAGIYASSGAGGSITPEGGVAIIAGANYNFEIVPGTGYHIADVLVNGVSIGAVSGYTFENVNESHTIHAVFEINVYTITAIPNNPDWGRVEGDGDYEHGQGVVLEAIPFAGYVFVRWTANDQEVAGIPEYTFDAVTHLSLIAHFDSETWAEAMVGKRLEVFPNPFSQTLTIRNAAGLKTIIITNILGKTVLVKSLEGSETEVIITDLLPKGIYLISLVGNNGVVHLRKMVKM